MGGINATSAGALRADHPKQRKQQEEQLTQIKNKLKDHIVSKIYSHFKTHMPQIDEEDFDIKKCSSTAYPPFEDTKKDYWDSIVSDLATHDPEKKDGLDLPAKGSIK